VITPLEIDSVNPVDPERDPELEPDLEPEPELNPELEPKLEPELEPEAPPSGNEVTDVEPHATGPPAIARGAIVQRASLRRTVIGIMTKEPRNSRA
jgi:hypothetical protein